MGLLNSAKYRKYGQGGESSRHILPYFTLPEPSGGLVLAKTDFFGYSHKIPTGLRSGRDLVVPSRRTDKTVV